MSLVSGERPASFESIEGAIAAKGDKAPMGSAFEHAVLHYLEYDPVVGFKQAWLWDDWPERIDLGLDRDQGVDIVAIDGEGKRVAVQVKFHSDPERNVTQREVATLFGFRSDLFDRWSIVSNAVGRSANAEKATAGRGDITWVHRDDLVASDIDWSAALEAVSGKAEPKAEPKDPREPDQTAAIADTLAALKEHERVQIIMACGTGKTLVTRWITEARKDRLVLVLVPTLLLLKQFRTQWREQASYDFIDLGVCSDADTMESSRDVWQVHPDELGVRVTTDPADIAAFLKGKGRRVIFGTYASSARIAEAQADASVPAFDLVVADEAHRVAGITSRGNARQRDTKVVLDGERIRSGRRLFATATPRVYGPANRAMVENLEDVEFASMDDVEHFGVQAHRLWFKRAVELGRLVDYRLSVVVVTDAEVENLIRERAYLDVQGRRFDAETLAALIAVRRAVDELGVNRVITFHTTVKRARDFARELERLDLDAPAVEARHVSGAMSMGDRQRVLARLKDPQRPTVVANARCLTEGIDVPALGAVAFVDPRSAPVDIVQAVGRVMRIAEGKELGHVIVPVYLTEEQLDDPEAAVESSAFEPVLAVLRALRAHDPELVTDATRIATSLGRRDAIVGGYLPSHVSTLGAVMDARAFEAALTLRLVEVTADPFEVGMIHLSRFVEREGVARPAQAHHEDGFPLGRWVNKRRGSCRRGSLPPSRIARLESMPGWTWEPLDERWDRNYALLTAFCEREGHAIVPRGHLEDGYPLGAWVGNLRAFHRDGRLSADRVTLLEGLPGWTWDAHRAARDSAIGCLRRFVEREGHARVPPSHVEDGFKLGRWVATKRVARRSDRLDPGQAKALEGFPGWSWDPVDLDWQEGLANLRRFVEREGHARPLNMECIDGYQVGRWVQRRKIPVPGWAPACRPSRGPRSPSRLDLGRQRERVASRLRPSSPVHPEPRACARAVQVRHGR